MNRRLLTVEEVAERIGFSPITIAKWTNAKLSGWPQPRRVGGRAEWRWEIADVDRWISRQGQQARRGKPVEVRS